jgi:hypothetical protein
MLDIFFLFLSLVATFGMIELVEAVLRLKVENQALNEEKQAYKNEVKNIEDMHRLFTDLFRMCFNVLDLSQQILEELFPNGGSCISMLGPVLRKMFEYMMHPDLPFDFFHSGFCFEFKVHSSFADFQIFARAFARFIYSIDMLLPGTTFVVTAMEPVRGRSQFRSCDRTRVHSSYLFVVRFYDKNSQRSFLLQFECDAGNWFPKENFDVNTLEFHATRGLSSMVNGRMVPVLSIIRAICEKSAQWNIIHDAHFSSLENLLSMRRNGAMYSLHGCPYIVATDRCPFSFESSRFALEFSGCDCHPHERKISMEMLCERSKSDLSSLKCPFCKVAFPCVTYEPNRPQNQFSFDLTCLNQVLSPENSRELQREAKASVVKMVFRSESDDLDAELLSRKLSNASKAPIRKHFRPQENPIDSLLFFKRESDDESEDESDDESEDEYDDESDDESDGYTNYSEEWESSDDSDSD